MRKLFSILSILVLLTSCDDGDITLESFNFEGQTILDCDANDLLEENLLFKTKNDELLLINLLNTSYNTLFIPEETGDAGPRTVPINSNSQVIYRKYTGTVSRSTVCSTIPVSSPTVAKEWVATGGTISVETNEVRDPNTNEVIAHIHNITFTNVNFSSSDNSFSFSSYIFGDYRIDI